MKTIEEIKEEYKEYKTQSTFVTTLEDFITFLDVGIDESNVGISDFSTEIHENKKWQITAFIRNLFPMFFEEEDIEFYNYDNELLEQGVSLAYTQKEYYQVIKNIANEENYKELLRLTDFAADYYCHHIDYIEAGRDILEMRFKGYTMYNSRFKDNRKSFHEFFVEKINELTPHKVVAKIK
jgi:hypothetical protein